MERRGGRPSLEEASLLLTACSVVTGREEKFSSSVKFLAGYQAVRDIVLELADPPTYVKVPVVVELSNLSLYQYE